MGEQSIEEYIANRQPGTKDCIGPLLDYRDENGQALSLASLQIEANMMLVGGTDTTSTTTAYTAWEIARNPVIQETLFRELKEAFPDRKSEMKLKEVEKLSYLTNCLKEGLRMHAVLPGPTCRVVPDGGVSLCGQHLPPGVTSLSSFPYKFFFYVNSRRLPSYKRIQHTTIPPSIPIHKTSIPQDGRTKHRP